MGPTCGAEGAFFCRAPSGWSIIWVLMGRAWPEAPVRFSKKVGSDCAMMSVCWRRNTISGTIGNWAISRKPSPMFFLINSAQNLTRARRGRRILALVLARRRPAHTQSGRTFLPSDIHSAKNLVSRSTEAAMRHGSSR